MIVWEQDGDEFREIKICDICGKDCKEDEWAVLDGDTVICKDCANQQAFEY